jgi:hypothetical protein
MDEANGFFSSRIEISPTPFYCEEEVVHEVPLSNYMSPSKFLTIKPVFDHI